MPRALSSVPESFASRFRSLMGTYRYTQRDVAERVGTTQQTVARWANGANVPAPKFLARLETAFGLAEGELAALVAGVELPDGPRLRLPADLTTDELAQVQAYVDLVVRARRPASG